MSLNFCKRIDTPPSRMKAVIKRADAVVAKLAPWEPEALKKEGQSMTIREFAEEHALVPHFELMERGIQKDRSWIFCFQYCEVSDDRFVGSDWGEAKTPHLAMLDYAKNISGKTLIHHRREERIKVPVLSDRKKMVFYEWPDEDKVYD